MTTDSTERAALVAAIEAAMAEAPPKEPERAAHLVGAAGAALSDEEFDARLTDLMLADEEFADRVEGHLGGSGTREAPIGLGPSTVPAIWWKCPEPTCTLDQQAGDDLGPHLFFECPEHGIRLVRA